MRSARTTRTRGLWGAIALAALALLFLFPSIGQWLTLDQLKASQAALGGLRDAHPVQSLLGFFVIYVLAVALSVPGAAVLTLAAGALFGFWTGLLVVSFASSLGALLAFLTARGVLRAIVQQRFGALLSAVNAGLAKDGTLYLLTLRLVPVFPFWLVNLVMGLTALRAGQFYVVSQLGMLAGTAVYVNAGTQLADLQSTADILSPGLAGSLVLLAVFPWLAKRAIEALKQRKLRARWPRPACFDRNLVVIGAGAGGLVSAWIAAAVGAKVTLIERHKMGGDCLNYGCVPSKALIRSAKAARQLKEAESLGLRDVAGRVDFAAVMQRVRDVIQRIEPHDSVERYTRLGVEVLQGEARITSPWTVDIKLADGSNRQLTTRNIVIAAGAAPKVPDIPGLKEAEPLTSDTVWTLPALPRRLLVLGGGPIGCELAQSFARLGSEVTLVEAAPRILVREDAQASEQVLASLVADGVRVLAGHQAVRVEREGDDKRMIVRHGALELPLEFDALLCAVGRSPRVSGYGLEELGIALTADQRIETNAWLQTLHPNIYAVGDVASPLQLTHVAAHQAWYAVVNALFGRFKKFKVDVSAIPRATFTDPEVAHVGLTESEAHDKGIAFEVTQYGIDDLDRAIADGTAHGFVKVLTVPGKDKILGVTIVGEHAADLLAEYVLAMKHGLGLNKILGTVHTYPTLSEANKYAAGQWRRNHAPQRLLRWVARFHAWERAGW